MSRKLYALFILIGAIGSLVLVYLYYFVYYTSTLTIESNVGGYTIELFSKSTAQKWTHECPDPVCFIAEVAPFEYNVTVLKEDYETQLLTMKLAPRRKETLFIELEKQASLVKLEQVEQTETPKQKIQRLREKNLYHASFLLSENEKITFTDDASGVIEMQHRTSDKTREIAKFGYVPTETIHAEYIGDSNEIYLKIGNTYYIYRQKSGTLYTLPYTLEVLYIKPGITSSQYIVVTDKGGFLYDVLSEESEFYYLFKDFVYLNKDEVIGVIYADEDQKKENFNLTDIGNLIVKYSIPEKNRKVLLQNTSNIERIFWKGTELIFVSGGNEYELKNF